MRIRCTEELHDHGGPGRFLLARAEDALDGLLAEYEGRATLIYLDPPSGAGDTFHLCLGRGQKPLALPVSDDRLEQAVEKVFDLRPAAIIRDLDLRRPIYRQLAAYGHFGRTDLDLPWERTDRIEALKAAL